jgi:hypothetical protein
MQSTLLFFLAVGFQAAGDIPWSSWLTHENQEKKSQAQSHVNIKEFAFFPPNFRYPVSSLPGSPPGSMPSGPNKTVFVPRENRQFWKETNSP